MPVISVRITCFFYVSIHTLRFKEATAWTDILVHSMFPTEKKKLNVFYYLTDVGVMHFWSLTAYACQIAIRIESHLYFSYLFINVTDRPKRWFLKIKNITTLVHATVTFTVSYVGSASMRKCTGLIGVFGVAVKILKILHRKVVKRFSTSGWTST